jgi:hypothetical protein
MTRRPAILIAALATALAACATAPAQPGADTGKLTASMEGQTAPDGTPIRCRAMDTIGTRFAQKECKSAKAWEEFDKLMADNAKEQTDKIQRVGSGPATSAGQ